MTMANIMNTIKKHQQGMTLIELMIALVISLVLLGSLIEVYLGSKQSYNLVEESSRLQENGRFAINIMTRDIRGADFWGCLRKPDDKNLYNNLNFDPNDPAQAQQYGFDTSTVSGTDGGGSNPDSISFGGAVSSAINITQQMVQSSGVIMVNADNGIEQGDILLLSDCSNGDIFQASNANPGGTGTIVHNTGAVTTPGNASDPTITGCNGANAHCLSKVYGTDAKVYEVGSTVYDIQVGANGSNGLFRNGIEIIENVDNMQILYGEDTDGDRYHTPDRYMTAANIGDIDNAITVRVALLLRGERDLLSQTPQTHQLLDQAVITNDQRIYKVFTTTITIRNRALIDSL